MINSFKNPSFNGVFIVPTKPLKHHSNQIRASLRFRCDDETFTEPKMSKLQDDDAYICGETKDPENIASIKKMPEILKIKFIYFDDK